MDAVREWAVALCAAAVLCAGAEIISPDERKSKGMRMILSSVMLCAMILPLVRMPDCGGEYGSAAAQFVPDRRLCAVVEEQTASAVSGTVRRLVEECLDEYDVEAEDISVSADISDDGCISIGQITITTACPLSVNAEEFSEQIYSRLGLRAEIITGEGAEWKSPE